jgi:hypothetical protein
MTFLLTGAGVRRIVTGKRLPESMQGSFSWPIFWM